MIRSYRSKTLERFALTGNRKGLSVQKPERIARLLKALQAATRPNAMDLPGLRFHALKGAGDAPVRRVGKRELASDFRLGWRRCNRSRSGGLSLMRKSKNMTAGLGPVHPGALLREDILPAIKTSKVEIARALGISRAQLYAILSERAPVTAPMALRLGRFFGNGPELWLNMQSKFDLEKLERSMAREIARIPTMKAA